MNQKSLRQLALLLLVVCAPFSKLPYLPLPILDFPSFRIGLYQLLAVFFLVVSLPLLIHSRQRLYRDKHIFIPVILLLVCLGIGLINAVDVGRGLLLGFSLLFLLLLFVCAVLVIGETKKKSFEKVISYMMWAGVFYAGVSYIQLLVATLTSDNVLLCKGCTDAVFGFARINGFSAEPLFWANALLPFYATSLYKSLLNPSRLSYVSLAMTSSAIGLTFARGAYVAVLILSLVMVYGLFKGTRSLSLRASAATFSYVAVGLFASFSLLIGAAIANYPKAPYIAYNTARGMAEHLSLGIISLPQKNSITQSSVTNSAQADLPAEVDSFVSEGLVEASQNERLESARTALKALTYDARTLIFGVGIGNLGPFASSNLSGNVPYNLTVYVYYILLLSELGVLGVGAWLYLHGTSFYRAFRAHIGVAAILSGFFVQYFFFGSYINALYVWIWFGIGYGIAAYSSKRSG